MSEVKVKIQDAILKFNDGTLSENAIALFRTLDYNTTRQSPLEKKTYACFKENYISDSILFNEKKALTPDWKYVDLLFQLSKEEVLKLTSLFDTKKVDRTVIETYLFFAIELSKERYSRTQLSLITREVNRLFPMPVMILFKHGNTLTFSVINRRLHKRDENKDVLEKVTQIKDINIVSPHRAHIEILFDLSFDELKDKHQFTNFVELHNAWQKTLNTKELNKRFYQELANWYFWAMNHVSFPDDIEKKKEIRNATNLIRLITRIIFIWFIKEKDLIPEVLFDPRELKKILTEFAKNKESISYYQAILQNLFFGTLNQKMDERDFAKDGSLQQNKSEYGIKTLFRYANQFAIDEKEAIALFKDIPFLNGGLFDCLDKENDEGKVLYADGFSRNTKKQAIVPDFLFFSEEEEYDLNEIFGTKNKCYKVKGLINILTSYKFTVTENTPIEEEVALDPELLGKVFENLLASYNQETRTTTRKLTGSFYTPREIVNYMVDESLKAYLKQTLTEKMKVKTEDAETGLDILFSYTEREHAFTDDERKALIVAIDVCKIIDPACGSGAFPMGILHKLVYILHKLDPKNELWKQKQIEKVKAVDDSVLRDQLIADIETTFENNELDYGRKLYLIENCIYGVDIQSIAVQIAKLRFFISLVVDQKKQPEKENLGIRSLPNLETKFVAANTLICLENPQQMTLKNPEIERFEKELKELRHSYFSAKTRKEKMTCQKEDKTLRAEIAKLLVDDGWNTETAKQIVAFDPYDQNASSPFFDPEWMFGLKADGPGEGVFDVVIANPPYVSHDKIINKEILKKNYFCWEPFADLYCYFIELGILLQKNNGILSYITSNSYLRSNYGNPLKKLIHEKNNILQLINIEDFQVFSESIVNTSITISQKKKENNKSGNALIVNKIYDSKISFEEFISKYSFIYKQEDFEDSIWSLIKPRLLVLRKKIESEYPTLENYGTKIRLGIATGSNESFIIDEKTKERLIKEDKRSNNLIKRVLRGRDIDKWVYANNQLYILLTKNGINVKDYPAVYNYLDSFGEKFKKRGAKGQHWTNLRACAFFEDFKKEKIIWIPLSDIGRFALCKEEIYLLNSAYFLLSPRELNSRHLLALLNSKLILFYLTTMAQTSGMGTSQWMNDHVKKIPIPKISPEQQKPFIQIVDQILAITKDDDYLQNSAKQDKVGEYERQIDRMVYKLYRLTDEEIKIVEGGK